MASSEDNKQAVMTVSKDDIIDVLMGEISSLKAQVSSLAELVAMDNSERQQDAKTIMMRRSLGDFYASPSAGLTSTDMKSIPDVGMPAKHVKELIDTIHLCDFQPRLNTSSYVNVVFEPEEEQARLCVSLFSACACPL